MSRENSSQSLSLSLPWCISPVRECRPRPHFPSLHRSVPSTSSIVLGVGGVEEDELRLQGRVLRKRFVVEPRLPLQARRGKSVRMAVAEINQRFSTDGVSAPVCQTPVNNWGRGSDCHSIPLHVLQMQEAYHNLATFHGCKPGRSAKQHGHMHTS